LKEERFNAAYRNGTFSYDYDVSNNSGEQSTGWTVVDTSGRVIYQERSAAVVSVAKNPDHRDDELRVITGTAFAVSDSGYLLTNAHVVQGCSKVELTSAKTSAEVMQSDRSNDLALLHAILPGNRYARIGRAEDFTLGTEVIIFGFPLNGVVASSGNLTTGVVSAVTGIGDDSRYFQLTAPIQPGNSGGPVMNEYGEVIGVASAMLDQQKAFAATGTIPQNVNFAIGPSMIRQFLSANGIPAASLTTWWRFKQGTQKLAQSAEAFTYSVKCEPKGTREERKIE
jgi:S1-C subfamily serine protease